MDGPRELDLLQATLNEAIDAIREELLAKGLPPLSTLGGKPHPLDNPQYVASPRLFEARKLALGSMGQLRNLLQAPYEKIVEQSFAAYDTACLDIVLKTGILDTISERSEGCSISEISATLALDPRKVATVLRYLAAQGWFLENSQEIYSLSRAGLELRRGQNGRTWAQTPGKAKFAASLLDMVTHPEWKTSSSVLNTAFQLSYKTPLSLFEYLKQYPADLEVFSSGVGSLGNVQQCAIINDYPWEKFTPGIFVDCGGGHGHLSISLAKRFQNSRFIIQDRPELVPIALGNILREDARANQEERLLAEAHDFFQIQPRQADVYIFKHILHDWPESACVDILKNVAKVAPPQARILIIDIILSPSTYSNPDQNNETAVTLQSLTGSEQYRPISPPMFMPMNFGVASKMSLGLGVHMMGVFNACERTLVEWEQIVTAAGLYIDGVTALRTNISVVECRFRAATLA
ncbi:S-adenosyl-L-methionine-dependent methyltransferase [Mycena galericulata]|nr:S-adenosyl-L-methionine-dependent methyltransferase [Mycena galericulata]